MTEKNLNPLVQIPVPALNYSLFKVSQFLCTLIGRKPKESFFGIDTWVKPLRAGSIIPKPLLTLVNQSVLLGQFIHPSSRFAGNQRKGNDAGHLIYQAGK